MSFSWVFQGHSDVDVRNTTESVDAGANQRPQNLCFRCFEHAIALVGT